MYFGWKMYPLRRFKKQRRDRKRHKTPCLWFSRTHKSKYRETKQLLSIHLINLFVTHVKNTYIFMIIKWGRQTTRQRHTPNLSHKNSHGIMWNQNFKLTLWLSAFRKRYLLPSVKILGDKVVSVLKENQVLPKMLLK